MNWPDEDQSDREARDVVGQVGAKAERFACISKIISDANHAVHGINRVFKKEKDAKGVMFMLLMLTLLFTNTN